MEHLTHLNTYHCQKHIVPTYLQIQYIPIPPDQAQSNSDIYRRSGYGVKRLPTNKATPLG